VAGYLRGACRPEVFKDDVPLNHATVELRDQFKVATFQKSTQHPSRSQRIRLSGASIPIPSRGSGEFIEIVSGIGTQHMVDDMTWQRLTPSRIIGMKFFCAMAEMFSLADLRGNAIEINGHKLIQTNFRVRGPQGKRVIYYCPCGQVAIGSGDKILGVADDASESDLTLCKSLDRRSRPYKG